MTRNTPSTEASFATAICFQPVALARVAVAGPIGPVSRVSVSVGGFFQPTALQTVEPVLNSGSGADDAAPASVDQHGVDQGIILQRFEY